MPTLRDVNRVGPGSSAPAACQRGISTLVTRTLAFLLTVFTALVAQPAAAQNGPWTSLFDGKTMTRGASSRPTTRRRCATAPGAKDCWEIVNGVLQKDGHANDIASKEQFGDFELELEWKIGDASNSGVFYRGTDEFNQIYWSAPEYQLLDNVNAADNKKDNHLAGSVYDLFAAPKDAAHPANEWNQTRIVAKGKPRRALAERQEGRLVRRRQRRVGCRHQGQQVQAREIPQLREGAEGLSRHPGRSSRDARSCATSESAS